MGQGASADGVLAHLARQEQRAAVSSWGKQQLVAIDSIGNCSLNANEWWLHHSLGSTQYDQYPHHKWHHWQHARHT